MAAWKSNRAGDYGVNLLSRRVIRPAQVGELDGSGLAVGRIDEGGSYNERTTIGGLDGAAYEDPRVAWAVGGLVCGLTAVVWEEKENAHKAYPAVTEIEDGVEVGFKKLRVLKELGWGKNTTPVASLDPSDNGLFLFRPDDGDHKLTMFHYSGDQAETIREVLFASVPEWGKHRMGTGMPPIWHEDGRRAVIILHGMTYNPKRNLYTYSLGRGFLERGREWCISVCPEPLLKGEDFADWPQLHPELRLVIYNTGGVIIGDSLRLFINIGDKCTIVRDIPLKELWKG